jgi:hypothetical protein
MLRLELRSEGNELLCDITRSSFAKQSHSNGSAANNSI